MSANLGYWRRQPYLDWEPEHPDGSVHSTKADGMAADND
jgi:hypothetical protein